MSIESTPQIKTQLLRTLPFDTTYERLRRLEFGSDSMLWIEAYRAEKPYSFISLIKSETRTLVNQFFYVEHYNFRDRVSDFAKCLLDDKIVLLDQHEVHLFPNYGLAPKKTFPISNPNYFATDPVVVNYQHPNRVPYSLQIKPLTEKLFLVLFSDQFRVRCPRYFSFLEFNGEKFSWLSPLTEIDRKYVEPHWRPQIGSSEMLISGFNIVDQGIQLLTRGGGTTTLRSGNKFETNSLIDYNVNLQHARPLSRIDKFLKKQVLPSSIICNVSSVKPVIEGNVYFSYCQKYFAVKEYRKNRVFLYRQGQKEKTEPFSWFSLTPKQNLSSLKHNHIGLAFNRNTLIVGNHQQLNFCQLPELNF